MSVELQLEKKVARRVAFGSISFMLGAVIYVLTEAISAYAWQEPTYRYAYNYISDLGVAGPLTIDGREVLSPLAWVMNAGFMAHGLLFALGYWLLLPLLEGKAKFLALAAAVIHGIGNVMIGYFPGVSYDGLSPHLIGAGLAIIGGNLAVMLGGASIRRSHPGLGRSGVGLGAFGLLALGIMVSGIFGHPAVFERLSVYSMTAWDLIFGFTMLPAFRPGRK
ncbi:DUF998 domain-containing protein [Saccharibacillus endophyticus]|uniref:DUF998 domain-containing protein n=1 Tax=Saccharibacillus endophyticus TaxID=2060666 RepID=A0ABQ1ZRU7_9BACL|nr:DUF998 domain-containing protein [Saccharibacillus endophyticus]GGH77310.1 hypothetical protein GCM10007362_20870 [Saccharibacillus endophyticus]